METTDWPLQAKCRGMDDAFFPEGADQKYIRTLCYTCPVRNHCLAEALDNRIEYGVWGGFTERERRALLRQRNDVTSWTAVLVPGAERQPDPAMDARAELIRAEVQARLAHGRR